MSSAEVFCWGSLGPVPGDENPVPVEDGRSGLVRQVYAGSNGALLARANGAKWVPDQRFPNSKGGDHSWNLSGIECAAFGQNHAVLLRSIIADGNGGGETKTEVLAWGSGEQGQLGLGAGTSETRLPKAITALSAYRVVQVACGALHSAAITSYGDLFTWGRGTEGQLGHASRHLPPELNDAITGVQLRPKPVPTFLATKKRQRPVAGVSCGANFTLAVTRVGEVWAFGGGAMGQLGIGRLTRAGVPTVVMPSCPATGEPFVEVAAGWAHSLARTSGGRVYSWGFNALGSLGLGDNRTRFVPEGVALNGRQHSEDEDGFSSSSSSRGVIGDGVSSSSPVTITNHVAVVKIRAGGNSSGVLTARGELLTWGSGTTGGLGHGGGGRRCQSRSERVEHVLRPRRVERLEGAEATDFALSSSGGVALVPLRVKSIEPSSGPMEAGCKVLVKGHGFWDSPDIVVKFTPISKGHKPSASRSAVGTYVRREAGQDRNGLGGGLELLACTAPRFASPEAAYVEVSVDGTSFTTDCVKFQYYRTPEVTQITPDICRPPFSRLRLDGDHLKPNETFLVRFEEDEEKDSTETRVEGCPEEANNFEISPPLESSCEGKVTSPSRSLPRVFTVSGRVESEVVEIGTDPETEFPVHEERWFLGCDSPALSPEAKLPFVARVTVAPNGADFTGEHLRFIAHDPHADVCRPSAVPVPDAPPLACVPSDGGGGDEHSERAEAVGPRIHIAGRNLYHGPNLAVRLRFGLDDESVIPLRTVWFEDCSESIVGVMPTEAGALVTGAVGATRAEPQCPPAIEVAVEASVDGHEYFAVPDRLTLYRSPRLTLQGSGLFPEAVGGWAELKTATSTFRGHDAKVRMVSDVHEIDVTLPLLLCPPLEEVEEGAQKTCEVPPAEESEGGLPPKEQLPSASENTTKEPPTQEPLEEAVTHGLEQESCEVAGTGTGKPTVWEEREVSTSEESFFFAVPPLPKQAHGDQGSCGGGSHPLSEEGLPASISTGGARGQQDEGAAAVGTATPKESTTALDLLVTLNGIDWQTVLGPPLTYFQPPPEPVPEPEEEPKKGKGRKR